MSTSPPVFLNRDVMLDDRAALTIGDHTMIAAGVVIETHSHAYVANCLRAAETARTKRTVAVIRGSGRWEATTM